MTPRIIKVLLRIVGTLAGFFGLSVLLVTPYIFYSLRPGRDFWGIGLATFMLVLAAYLLYVAYLAWFRFSPRAVRHICGALGFYVMTLVANVFDPANDQNTLWTPFAFLGCLVAVYFAYRWASTRLSCYLFPEVVSRVQP